MQERCEDTVPSEQGGGYESPALVDLGTLDDLTKGASLIGPDVCGTFFQDPDCPVS